MADLVIDLNVDAGESFGAYVIGADDAVIPLATSVNVACGLHGGDPNVMRKTVRLAARHHVAVGAHPGYPDLQGFGRRRIPMTPDELVPLLLYQIGALRSLASAEGVSLQHLKAHGALYNVAVQDPAVAGAITDAARTERLILVALAGSAWAEKARRAGVLVAEEAFVDRGYQDDGTLMPRSDSRALITDPQAAARRAVRLVTEGRLETVSGREIGLRADTLCMHSDTPGADRIAQAVNTALREAGIRLEPLGTWLG